MRVFRFGSAESKILLFRIGGWLFGFLGFGSVYPGIFQSLHLKMVDVSPLQR